MDRSSKLINKNYSFISSSSTNIISYAGSQGRQLRIRTHGSISKKSLSCVWYISRMLQEMSAHNRRPRRHTAKTSPTVADGKAPTAATGTAKTLFAVCQKLDTRQTFSPCVYIDARRKKASRRRHGRRLFAVCLHRGHTVNIQPSPCALGFGTRQSMVSSPCARPRHTANLVSRGGQMVTLPCA